MSFRRFPSIFFYVLHFRVFLREQFYRRLVRPLIRRNFNIDLNVNFRVSTSYCDFWKWFRKAGGIVASLPTRTIKIFLLTRRYYIANFVFSSFRRSYQFHFYQSQESFDFRESAIKANWTSGTDLHQLRSTIRNRIQRTQLFRLHEAKRQVLRRLVSRR